MIVEKIEWPGQVLAASIPRLQGKTIGGGLTVGAVAGDEPEKGLRNILT
jgi:hypothetical protein